MKKICVITGCRSEYGIFYPILKKIATSKKLKLQLVVSTMHLSNEFGLTYKKIEYDGFKIDHKIDNLISSPSISSNSKSAGLAMILLSDVLINLKPDVVLLVGDRFETLAAASCAMLMNIPIAHIHGGEITEGSVDDKVRHSITKMSSIHFTSTEAYKNRVIQMGEDPKNVICSGAPAIESILNTKFISKKIIEKKISWKINNQFALFTYHPETINPQSNKNNIIKILDHIKKTSISVIFTSSNCDTGGDEINYHLKQFVSKDPNRYFYIENLGQDYYFSIMKLANLIIGNSSSGIIEAACFHKPVVNIGNRQKGRIHGENVINCNIPNLNKSISRALSLDFVNHCKKLNNIYYNKNSSDIIIKNLINTEISTKKSFYNL